jgi:hypothetical protein
VLTLDYSQRNYGKGKMEDGKAIGFGDGDRIGSVFPRPSSFFHLNSRRAQYRLTDSEDRLHW